MQTPDYFAKLNRLRVNVGKPELKSWKGSRDALLEQIDKFEKMGAVDVVPGANINAAPQTADPVVAEALAKPEVKPEPEEPKVTKLKPGLGRGLGDEKYATHSRKAVQDHRARERAEEKAERRKVKLSKEDQEQIADEAATRKKGQVDPKKDPEKAERQKKHIEEKQAKRKAEGKAPAKKEVGKDEVTVADIARELGMEPKIARAKLRRHEDKLTKLHTKGQDRWTFPKSAKAEIVKILK